MDVSSATCRGPRTDARVPFKSTPNQPPANKQQTSTQQLESSLPPDAKSWEKAIVGFLSFMSALFDPKK